MSEEIKNEIKFLKLSVPQGVLEYKITQPRKNNGCILTFMPLTTLEILLKMVKAEIKRKKDREKKVAINS